MYFEIYTTGSLIQFQWRWRLRSASHEVIASGVVHHNKQDCLQAINLIKSTTSDTPVYQVTN